MIATPTSPGSAGRGLDVAVPPRAIFIEEEKSSRPSTSGCSRIAVAARRVINLAGKIFSICRPVHRALPFATTGLRPETMSRPTALNARLPVFIEPGTLPARGTFAASLQTLRDESRNSHRGAAPRVAKFHSSPGLSEIVVTPFLSANAKRFLSATR